MINLSTINLGVAGGSSLPVIPVDILPATGQTGRVYLIPNPDSTSAADAYLCKIWNGTEYVSAGTAELQIQDYESRLQNLEENSVGVI